MWDIYVILNYVCVSDCSVEWVVMLIKGTSYHSLMAKYWLSKMSCFEIEVRCVPKKYMKLLVLV